MMKQITCESLTKEYNEKLAKLQKECKHPKNKLSKWTEHFWVIGHSTGMEIRVCGLCGSIIEQRKHIVGYVVK